MIGRRASVRGFAGLGLALTVSCCPGAASPSAASPSAPSAPGAPAATAAPAPSGSDAPAAATQPAPPAPEPASTSEAAAPPPQSPEAESETPAEAEARAAEEAARAAATGPAIGGPRGTRPCAFHESVDSYQRQCVCTVDPDGAVRVTAKGTKLNPDNGFEFTMHGGENHQWFAKGTLNAFEHCEGPFTGIVTSVIDKGVHTYEIRFKRHCKIVVR